MFSFFKKKPATPDPAVETPAAEAAPATPAAAEVQAAPAAPEAPAAAEVAPASGGWLNRLRRSFGGDDAAAGNSAAPETAPAGELPLAEQALIQALQHDAMDSSSAALEPTPIDEAALTEAALAAVPEDALDHAKGADEAEAPPAASNADADLTSAASSPSEAGDSEDEATDAAATAARAGWFNRLKTGLRRTGSSITTVFTGTKIDEELYEDLEAALLMADAGVQATEYLLEDLKRRVKAAKATDPAQVRTLLTDAIAELLQPLEKQLVIGEHTPTVIMVAGVNGAGKTTSIGKLTKHLSDHQQSVLLAAADTFRAAAREQLGVWATRNTVEIISQEGGDPAAVSFDAGVGHQQCFFQLFIELVIDLGAGENRGDAGAGFAQPVLEAAHPVAAIAGGLGCYSDRSYRRWLGGCCCAVGRSISSGLGLAAHAEGVAQPAGFGGLGSGGRCCHSRGHRRWGRSGFFIGLGRRQSRSGWCCVSSRRFFLEKTEHCGLRRISLFYETFHPFAGLDGLPGRWGFGRTGCNASQHVHFRPCKHCAGHYGPAVHAL